MNCFEVKNAFSSALFYSYERLSRLPVLALSSVLTAAAADFDRACSHISAGQPWRHNHFWMDRGPRIDQHDILHRALPRPLRTGQNHRLLHRVIYSADLSRAGDAGRTCQDLLTVGTPGCVDRYTHGGITNHESTLL